MAYSFCFTSISVNVSMMSPTWMSLKLTLEVHAYLLDVVLEALEGVDFACVYDYSVANHAGLVHTVHLALRDVGSGHGAHFRYVVNLAHLYLSCHHFLLHFVEHSLHGRLHVLDGVVDYGVGVDFNAFLLGQLARRR